MNEKKPEKKNLQALNKRYQNRFTFARVAREAFKKSDYIVAIKNYNEYLKTMGDIHDQDPLELQPSIFDPNKDVSEMLLVSQIYWELAKIYDMTPKLQGELSKVLNQFVVFTINQPFQVVNAEILRKYLKKPGLNNHNEFKAAYDKIFIESDKCYISTLCFGNNSFETKNLRNFKDFIKHTSWGLAFIKNYYRASSRFVFFLKDKPLLVKVFNFFIKPPLRIFSILAFVFLSKNK